MRIALDAGPLRVRGGIARYTAELAAALRGLGSDEIELVEESPRTYLERRWWLYGLPARLREWGAEVFHGTDFAVPYRRVCASVLTLHDLSPWKDEGWQRGAGRVRRRTPWLLRLGRADVVVTLTEAVRREAIEQFGLQPERVRAVPLAPARIFRPVAVEAPAKPYFLCLGTIEPRKNVGRVVEAWRELRDRADLVLVGRRREDGPVVVEEPGLRWLGEIEDEALPALMCGAVAVLYPSHYEGFGLPVVEAMQCGAAVVASRDAAVMEVSGGAALHAAAGDTREWVEEMRGLLDAPEEVKRRCEMGRRRAAEFTWERTARETRAVYVEAVERFRG